MKLKLYVWEDVLEDYTQGVMFALAPNKEEARRLIAEKMGYDRPVSDLNQEPKEVTKPEGFYLYGGG
jgi:hypothetical protein